MGQESSRVMSDRHAHEDPKQIEKDITEIRKDLDREMLELDRRRHAFTRSSARVLHNPGLTAGAVAIALGALAGLIAYEVWQARKQRAPRARLRELGRGLGRALQHPDQIARPQPILVNRLLAAVAGAAASELAKRFVDRALKPSALPRLQD